MFSYINYFFVWGNTIFFFRTLVLNDFEKSYRSLVDADIRISARMGQESEESIKSVVLE